MLGWLVTTPRPLRERAQSCLRREAKGTNAGVGLTQELRQFAPLCSVKLFSDTLPLCSRYRFENLSLASLCLNLASAAFPCHPIPECVMLNLFQHLTVLVCDLCKILNSLKIALETKTHNNIINNDFLRFQDDNKYPSQPSLNREGVRPIVQSTLSPRPLWRREQSYLRREAKATNAGEGLKTINQQYPPTVSDHFPLKGGRCAPHYSLALQFTSSS